MNLPYRVEVIEDKEEGGYALHCPELKDGYLIIFTETSGMIEPGEGAFNYPAPRESFPLVGLDFL